MLDELKKLTLKSMKRRLIACSIVVILLLAIIASSLLKLIQGPKDMKKLSEDELLNSYVEADVNFIYDTFAQYEESDSGHKDITQYYYIINANSDEKVMGLLVNSGDFKRSEKLFNESGDYFSEATDKLPSSWKVRGTITKMDDDVYKYYKETIAYDFNLDTDDPASGTLPYILEVGKVGAFDEFTIITFLIIAGIMFLIGMYILIRGISGGYLSPVKKYLDQNNASISQNTFEMDYYNGQQYENVRVGQYWLLYVAGTKIKVFENKDIVWAYLQEVTQRVNFIKTGTYRNLVFYTKDKKKHRCSMKSTAAINSVLGVLSQTQPHIVLGYNSDLKKCFEKDYERFLQIPYMNRMEQNNQQNQGNPWNVGQ